MTSQLKSSAKKFSSHKEKQVFSRIVGKTIFKKYKLVKKVGFFSQRLLRWSSVPVKSNLTFLRSKSARAQATLKTVHDFYTDDCNSNLSPGKEEFCFKGQKEKVRYMTDSQSGLYEKFCASSPIKLSYSQFCKLRPPFVVKPKVSGRDTCACQKCENFKLLVLACHKNKIIEAKNGREIVNSLCCSVEKSDKCLCRECDNCREKVIVYNEFLPSDEIEFFQWKR